MATTPNDYREQVRASVDKAPALSPQKRAALRALLQPNTDSLKEAA